MIKRGKIIELLWLVLMIVLVIFSLKLILSGELELRVDAFGFWAPLVIVVLKISTLVIAPLGGMPLYVIAGALWGSWYSFLLCFSADIIGSTICFALSRRFGSKVLRMFVGQEHTERVIKIIGLLDNTKSFVKARLALLQLPEIFAYASGLSKVRFLKFIIVQGLFLIPTVFLAAFVGSRLAGLASASTLVITIAAILISGIGFFLLYKDYKGIQGA